MTQSDSGLTERDVYWLQALAGGSEIKELKRGSPSVIKNRLIRLRRKHGCATTTQLVAMAVRKGWIQ